MRGAPQSGFVRLILRMRSRTSRDTSGLPGIRCLHFQVQYWRNPRRCQAMTVSGLTMMSAERQPDQRCSSHAHKRRSTSVSRTRPRCDLRSTFIWWRRARISNCKAARVWKQERRVPRKERNRVNIGSGKLSNAETDYGVSSPTGAKRIQATPVFWPTRGQADERCSRRDGFFNLPGRAKRQATMGRSGMPVPSGP
jgi:hypothetical protein